MPKKKKKPRNYNPLKRFFKKPEPEVPKIMPAVLTERPEGMDSELFRIARTNQNNYIKNYLKYGRADHRTPSPKKDK